MKKCRPSSYGQNDQMMPYWRVLMNSTRTFIHSFIHSFIHHDDVWMTKLWMRKKSESECCWGDSLLCVWIMSFEPKIGASPRPIPRPSPILFKTKTKIGLKCRVGYFMDQLATVCGSVIYV